MDDEKVTTTQRVIDYTNRTKEEVITVFDAAIEKRRAELLISGRNYESQGENSK
jgi:hypothetical protein